MHKNTVCLWFHQDAEAAAHFYAQTFLDSTVGAILLRQATSPLAVPGMRRGSTLRSAVSRALASTAGTRSSRVTRFRSRSPSRIKRRLIDWNAIVENRGAESACG